MQNSRANFLIVLSCLAVATLVEATLPASYDEHTAPGHDSPVFLPYHLGPFSGREAHSGEVKGYPGEIHRLYRQPGANSIELIAAPTADNHAPENCLPYMGWSIIERGHRTLGANSAIELQTIIAVSDDRADRPLACAFYWRRNNRATDNFLSQWLQQRWATVTQSLQNAELVSVCTSMENVRQAVPAIERVYAFTNELEPYLQETSTRLVGSAGRPSHGP